ncbi:putative invertase inhibitor [Rutidosis leptorrhynchoides]|uniref:putative invertase inhibitor n=1 Tax=Rutidosis leptorrhynchoides TaxID=125765 RepID=UPI003A9A45E7
MSRVSSFLSLFLFSSLLFSTHSQPLIHGTCELCSQQDPVVNYHFCTSSLESASGSRHTDIQGLGKISIKLTHNNLTDTRSHIKRLLKNDQNSYIKMRLEDCLELYSDAIVDIKRALKSYKLERYNEANILLSSVMDDATTCENGFQEKRNAVSPLTRRNNGTFELSAIGLSIIHILQLGDYLS